MDVGGKLLAALLREGNLYRYQKCKLDERYFVATEHDLWEFIVAHVDKYHVLPQMDTVKQHFKTLPTATEPPEYYLDLVEERFRHKTLQTALSSCTEPMKKQNTKKTESVLVDALASIVMSNRRMQIVDFGPDVKNLVMGAYYEKVKKTDPGIHLGWPTFDKMNGGLVGGDVVSIVGRPTMGKTWFVLWGALTAWLAGHDVMVVSMEMNSLAIVQRLTSIYAKINPRHLRNAEMTKLGLQILAKKLKDASNEPGKLWVIDGNMTATVPELFALVNQFRPAALFIDGAYLLKHEDHRLNKFARVETNLEEIKQRTTALDIPSVLSYQFNREAAKKMKKGKEKTGLEDIAFSDAVGQISSIVLGLFEEESVETVKRRTINIMKGRSGEVGEFEVNWLFDKVDFSEIEKQALHELQFV